MFSTKERLAKRTPSGGIGREEYIGHLVDEFHTTTNIEAQEQVTANLANFSYDPINYDYLRKSGAFELFLQLLTLTNERLVLHGIAGICNLCLDEQFHEILLQPNSLEIISNLLQNNHPDIILNALTTLELLITPKTKDIICKRETIKTILKLRNIKNQRIKNLATIFIEDHCSKLEEIQI